VGVVLAGVLVEDVVGVVLVGVVVEFVVDVFFGVDFDLLFGCVDFGVVVAIG
jgi:hypothetical protein